MTYGVFSLQILSQHLWAKADVVGADDAKISVQQSYSSPSRPSPKRNGSKHNLSDAIAKSESEDNMSELEAESLGNGSDESRFSDSEDDR